MQKGIIKFISIAFLSLFFIFAPRSYGQFYNSRTPPDVVSHFNSYGPSGELTGIGVSIYSQDAGEGTGTNHGAPSTPDDVIGNPGANPIIYKQYFGSNLDGSCMDREDGPNPPFHINTNIGERFLIVLSTPPNMKPGCPYLWRNDAFTTTTKGLAPVRCYIGRTNSLAGISHVKNGTALCRTQREDGARLWNFYGLKPSNCDTQGMCMYFKKTLLDYTTPTSDNFSASQFDNTCLAKNIRYLVKYKNGSISLRDLIVLKGDNTPTPGCSRLAEKHLFIETANGLVGVVCKKQGTSSLASIGDVRDGEAECTAKSFSPTELNANALKLKGVVPISSTGKYLYWVKK